jgi:hypothetical protein
VVDGVVGEKCGQVGGPTLSDHALQNLRTNWIGLSISLLLWSILLALRRAPVNATPTADSIPALPVAAAGSMNVRRETWGAESFFMSFAGSNTSVIQIEPPPRLYESPFHVGPPGSSGAGTV